MHQKNNAAAATSREDGDEDAKNDKGEDEGERLKNPFADDEEDEDADSDDDDNDGNHGSGAAGAVTGAWGASGRGSWWRGVSRRGGNQRFDGQDDSDDEVDDDDEEFGDFAMPEVDPAPGSDGDDNVILKPLAVHPPGSGGKAFGSLWPFGSAKDGKDEKSEKEGEETVAGEDEKPVQAAVEAARRTSIEEADDDEEVVVQKPSSL